ncbi:hypothetical protein [Halomonas llamarensis]|uniref:Uncharacterized protein n=1 Tax=Halomonas llamarensis TaxID=2945104 RepID=A0ABT0SUG9_9GAMM|nr:hypothetical protein [Halomonas llamarensis]MCL7931484.1 hypothetical protein [Halomonas llamarensis]MCL7931653.1 hypothetical protein [Halomonas llamarensis]
MSQQPENPTAWWRSNQPARHTLRREDGSKVVLSESDLDAMMQRWDQVVREMESASAEQRQEVARYWDRAVNEMGVQQ